ncbi:MAG: multiheme c-type cytochrome [Planctomycetota bacterium]
MEARDRQPRKLNRGALLGVLAVAALAVASVVAPHENESLRVETENVATEPQPKSTTAPLSQQDLALLAMACPSSIEKMPPHLREAFAGARRSHLVPPYRETAARPQGEWLVEPSEWFTPEDQKRPRPSSEEAPQAEPPADPSPPAQPPETPPRDNRIEPPALELPAERAGEPPPPVYEPPVVEPVKEPVAPPPPAERQPIAPIPMAPIPLDAPEPQTPAQSPAPNPEPITPIPAEAPAPKAEVEVIPPPLAEPTRPTPKVEPKLPTVTPEPERIAPPQPQRKADPPAPATPELFAPPKPAPPAATPQQPAPSPKLFAPPKPQAVPSPHQRPASPHGPRAKPLTKAEQKKADESHAELFAKNCYPSARECGECHKRQYDEWRVSSHAYAYVSPMFHKFEQKIYDISLGTVGYFCVRCHSPTAVAMNLERDTPLWDMPLVAREGVTCIACHRVNEHYSKANGERRVVPGDIHAPVYGGIGGDGVGKAIADKAKYKVKTSPHEKGAGQAIHNEGRFFHHLSQAEFCTSCHQVAVHPGVKLEVVWEQYRASPACKKGVTCQHCHMGTVPGVASPYEIGSIAEVGGKSVNNQRKHANHVFFGPGYSIAHPGVFPFNKKADRWAIHEWLRFDWRAGWGTEAFEDAVEDGKIAVEFPDVWKESDDRYDAREIIEDNQAALGVKTALRKQVMEHGSKVAGPFFKHKPRVGEPLKFNYVVTNLNEGHNLPTASLGAQPQLWANVVLIGPTGERLWETGYTDSYGDLADIHSVDVRQGRLKFDSQLFNLQTMFLITGATGTDREFFLPVNISIDQVPQLRPGAVPVSVLNHPPFIRMEGRSIAPLGSKRVKYSVPAKLITTPGRYRLSFRMRSRTEPIYFMRFCESTVEMQRAMNEGILDIHPYSVEFIVE